MSPHGPLVPMQQSENHVLTLGLNFFKNDMIPRTSSSSKIKMLRNKDDYSTVKWYANHLLPQDRWFLPTEIIAYRHFSLSCHPGSSTSFNNNNNKIKIRYLELLSLKNLAFALRVHEETHTEICLSTDINTLCLNKCAHVVNEKERCMKSCLSSFLLNTRIWAISLKIKTTIMNYLPHIYLRVLFPRTFQSSLN